MSSAPFRGFCIPGAGSAFDSLLSFHVSLLTLLLFFSPSAAHAQPGWSPDLQVTYINGSAFSPQIAVSGETLHVVWTEFARDSLGTYEDVLYVQSTDTGSHWTSPRMLSDRNPRSSVMASLALQGDELHVVWNRFDGGVCYRKSTDGGATWGSVDTSLIRRAQHPKIAVAGDSLYLVAVDAFNGITKFRKSTDSGTSWLPVQDLGPGWQFPQIVVRRNLVHVFVEYRPTTVEAGYVRSTNGGRTWLPMVMLSSDDNQGSFRPSLAGGDTLNVYALWTDYKYSPYPWTGDLFLRRTSDGGITWSTEETLTVAHRAVASDIIAQGDTLHVVWEDERVDPGKNFELFYRMSTNGGLTWDREVRLTYAPMQSYTPSLGLSGSHLHLVWSDGREDTTGNWFEVYYKMKVLFSSGVGEGSAQKSLNRDMYGLRIFPNPSNGFVWIQGAREGDIGIYDIAGRLVRRLSSPGGFWKGKDIPWDCRDEQGKGVKNGIYFIRMGEKRPVRKVVVAR